MTRAFQVTWILPLILASASFCLAGLEVAYEWKYIDYLWKNSEQRQEAIESGTYDHTKIIPTDVQPAPDGRVFVSTPRFSPNPASLSTIAEKSCGGDPKLKPYPNWSWHSRNDCSGIVSVIRTQLDECNRLWLVDSGQINGEKVCDAKIMGFDLKTDELVQSYTIPDEVAYRSDGKGLLELGNIESNAEDECAQIYLYMSDITGYAIVMWDGIDAWRVENKILAPQSEDDTINNGEMVTVEGESFFRRRGPESMVITPDGYLPEPWMLIKSLSNYTRTFAVTLSDLHNSKHGSPINYYGGIGTAVPHEPAKAWSKRTGTLFASFAEILGFACWNLEYPLADSTISFLTINNTDLQYVPSIKIVVEESTDTEYIWLMSNREQKYHSGTMDFDEVNFKVFRANLTELIAGTGCESEERTMGEGIGEKNFFFIETS